MFFIDFTISSDSLVLCLQGGLGISFWKVLDDFDHLFGDFSGYWGVAEISMDFRISPRAPLGGDNTGGEG